MPTFKSVYGTATAEVDDANVDAYIAAGWQLVEPEELPRKAWKVGELVAYAEQHSIDLGDATKKDDVLAAIEAYEAAPTPE